VDFKGNEFKGMKYTIQVAPEDCTGCGTLCVVVCPAKDKANPRHKALDMAPQRPLRDAEAENYAFFLDLPEADRTPPEARSSRARSSWSRCSSIRARAPAAAKRRTSSW
jgi:Fe-S-cluster-containing hydrogenase component 2